MKSKDFKDFFKDVVTLLEFIGHGCIAIASCKINHNYVCHHPLYNLALFLDNMSCLSVILKGKAMTFEVGR